eukprot:tig00020693_g13037.t2
MPCAPPARQFSQSSLSDACASIRLHLTPSALRPPPASLNAEAVASFVRAMDALGQRVPRSALVRSAAAALNVLRVAIAARAF